MGDIVAFRCVKHQKRPQLEMVLEMKDDKATIKWYDGTWTGKWKVYTYKNSRNLESMAWVKTAHTCCGH